MTQLNKNTNKLTNLELSIQISLSGLSFSILQKDSNNISVLKHFDFNKRLTPLELLDRCQNIFDTESHLQESFNNICVIHDNELSTLVPKPLFEEDCLADYLKFNSKILKSDFITYDDIVLNDSVNVYVPYININNFIYDKFGAFTFKHVSTILIEEILQIEKNTNTPRAYLNICKNHFEIVIIEKGKLLLYNTFEYTTKEDFIYYVLFTAEQLNLNPETLNVAFIGDIKESDDVYQIAYKYIRNISFGDRNDNYTYNENPKYNHSDFTLIKSF
ncbi:DUF3822 family protein [Flavivirga abyssicola]|uniref:DUF3822 family protein n=1 Tax=Flavivirga abyssicola TaxID=3063533 RepID=UPI0026E09CA5|nr:DUF3822 family protein [Flavivirga sp. MEBiC07777]WVK12836.1 DUF3822 family protein [Flavivirga sp. MEBiC07777]